MGLACGRQATQVATRFSRFSHPITMSDAIKVGDRVKIFLDSKYWNSRGWFEGKVAQIEPYSGSRSFYWVELEEEVHDALGNVTKRISVLNPRNIVKR